MSRNLISSSRRPAPDPFMLVIFGASGDLTRRKLVPAVFSLFRDGLLPEQFAVVGVARRPHGDEGFRREMRQAAAGAGGFDADAWERFARFLLYHQADFDDPSAYRTLGERLAAIRQERRMPGNRLFYLATPPAYFTQIVLHLHEAGLSRCGMPESPWTRLVVEKPFGRDLASAMELDAKIRGCLGEEQIFRIDHYLGKETVQNIFVLRFANSMFEPLWNNKHVDHVQITVSETAGAERRGTYYDKAGALRDIVQNHMMHLLCLVAMEPPAGTDADAIRDEKVKLLRALRPIHSGPDALRLVRGQYAAGTDGDRRVPGYLEEDGVAPDSTTETYAALALHIDNWRWSGVPFYLRTGKRLAARTTEIAIHFREAPRVLFNAATRQPLPANVLTLHIQPDEGISLRFQVKVPGKGAVIRPFQMDFGYAAAFGAEPPEAYERLLLDAFLGDQTLFTRRDEVEAAWRFLTPILDLVAAGRLPPPAKYAAGTWGPKEADMLIQADGRQWEVTSHPPADAVTGRVRMEET